MKIVLIGGGNSAFLNIEILSEDKNHEIAGYCARDHNKLLPLKYFGTFEYFINNNKNILNEFLFVITLVNDFKARRVYFERINKLGLKLFSVISKKSYISKSAKIGSGCFIGPFSTILPNSKIGDLVQIEDQCSIGINVEIGNCSVICPGVITGSSSSIGEDSFLGLGSTVNPKVKIGNRCLVGANSAVVKNIPNGMIAKGVPCVPFRKRD